MRIKDITNAAIDVIRIRSQYHAPPSGELAFELELHSYLQGRFGQLSRQLPVRIATRTRYIDLRYGGPNPVVIELALRPSQGGPQLYGSQNRFELRKLTRVPQTRAKRRVLLLADLYHSPIQKENLRSTYALQTSGPGNFGRNSVRVIYAHERTSYDFLWRP